MGALTPCVRMRGLLIGGRLVIKRVLVCTDEEAAPYISLNIGDQTSMNI
jgi:hypothetical protein